MDYILNGVNYQTLIMMPSDAPRYARKETEESVGDGAREIAEFFQGELK